MTEYALEGPKWAGQVITWSFASGGGSFTNPIGAAYQATIAAAIANWAGVTGLQIQQVSDGTPGVDIRIGWGSFSGSQIGQTDYSYQINGGGQTFLPGMTIRIEDPALDPLSSAAGSYYQGTSTQLYQVALHEFGHALGLGLSTDPSAVMFLSLGPSNTAISAADIAGVAALYGIQPASTAQATVAAPSPAALPPAVTLSGGDLAVYRFFDSVNGTQFLTADLGERNTLIQTRTDLTYEGSGLGAISPAASDPNAVPIYRFFDTNNGSHFFTASAAEAQQIAASRHDLVQEQSTFDEHLTQQAGDVAVYRFFDSGTGTHFFTDSASERASILASRPDMMAEGVAFYAPST